MTGFECNVTGATSTAAIGKPTPPKYCPNGGCVLGPKQPMYWANDNSNIVFSGDYYQKPSYNSKWGFSNGAQDDIFTGETASTTFITSIRPASSTTTATTPSATCAWPGHCAGSACVDENDCSDSLVCKSGICG